LSACSSRKYIRAKTPHTKLEFLAPSKLKPYRRNPRVNDNTVQALAQSIREFGFNSPILVGPNNRICAGHARWKAAKLLGLKRVPVVRIDNLTGQRFAAYNIADNQIASISEWDDDLLLNLLEELKAEEVPLPSLGFPDAQLQALLAPADEFDWDAFDESMRTKANPEYGLLPIKVRCGERELLRTAIRDYAEKRRISGPDFAIVAGKVLRRLLRLR